MPIANTLRGSKLLNINVYLEIRREWYIPFSKALSLISNSLNIF
jgi:hypothetical protein